MKEGRGKIPKNREKREDVVILGCRGQVFSGGIRLNLTFLLRMVMKEWREWKTQIH
jgi:hypothetical protein